MVVAATGVQAQVAEVECSIVGRGHAAAQAPGAGQPPVFPAAGKKRKVDAAAGQATAADAAASAAAMRRWLGGTGSPADGGATGGDMSGGRAASLGPGPSAADDTFAEIPMEDPSIPAGGVCANTGDELEQLCREARERRRRPGGGSPADAPGGVDPHSGAAGFVDPSNPGQFVDHELQAALSASLVDVRRALGPRDHGETSTAPATGAGPGADTEVDEAWQLEVAIALSLGNAPPPRPAGCRAASGGAPYRGGHGTGGGARRGAPVVVNLVDSDEG